MSNNESNADKKRKEQAKKTKGILDFLDDEGANSQHNTQATPQSNSPEATQKDRHNKSQRNGENDDSASPGDTQNNTQRDTQHTTGDDFVFSPEKQSETKRYNVYLDRDLVRELDYIAGKLNMSRSKLIRKLCHVSLDKIRIRPIEF